MQMYLAYLALLSLQAAVFHMGKLTCRSRDGQVLYVKKDGTALFMALACIELILLAGLRGHTIGADTKTYLDALRHYTGISFSQVFTAKLVWPFDFEMGYFLLTKVCGFLKLDPTVFLFVVAILVYVPQFYYIYKNSTHPYISLVVYFAFSFFSYSLGIFRQFIAIGIILLSLKYIQQKRFVPYLIAVLLAMQFHQTAFIALPLYFIARFPWRTKLFLVLTVAAEFVLLVIGRYVIQIAVTLFPAYAGYVGGRYDVQGGSYLNLIFLNLVLFLFCLANRQESHKNLKVNLIAAQLVMAIMLQCCAYHMAIFGRIVPYFSVALLVAIPDIIDGLSRKDPVMAFTLKAGACAILFLLVLRDFSGNSYVTPFYFFWQSL